VGGARGIEEKQEMAASIFDSLLSSVDSRSIAEVANAMGQPAQSVAKAMKPSIAALLTGLAGKSEDPGALRGIIDLVSGTTGQLSWPQLANSLADPNSPLMAMGKRVLPALFGNAENAVSGGISQASGLPGAASSDLLTMAAPMVMSFLANHMRVTGMNINGLGSILHRESASFMGALPYGIREIFQLRETTAEAVPPVIAQAARRQTSSAWLLPVLAIAALALGLIWLGNHKHRPGKTEQAPTSVGGANRATLTCTLPANTSMPAGRVESRLLAFVRDPGFKPTAWFTTDQLSFATGSANILPESQAELKDIAAILTNCPKVHITVAAFTDNVGGAEANLRLSRNRANAVVDDLVDKGVPRDRLVAEGHGEQNPIADNTTAAGRAQNRRVAMHVTQK
jgi:outer membrane protein OmpA-like peptidoglycan-associated protein